MMFSQDECSSLHLAGTNPLHMYGIGPRAGLLDRTRVFWWFLGQTWSSRELWQWWKLTASLSASTEVYTTDQGSNFLYATLVRPRILHPILGLQSTKDMDKLEGTQGRDLKAVGLEHLPQQERLGELGWVSLEDGWLWGTWQPPHRQLFYCQMCSLISTLLILFVSSPWFLILYSNLALQFSSYSVMPEQFDLLCNSTTYIILQGQC